MSFYFFRVYNTPPKPAEALARQERISKFSAKVNKQREDMEKEGCSRDESSLFEAIKNAEAVLNQ